jgi:hypothetical protein
MGSAPSTHSVGLDKFPEDFTPESIEKKKNELFEERKKRELPKIRQLVIDRSLKDNMAEIGSFDIRCVNIVKSEMEKSGWKCEIKKVGEDDPYTWMEYSNPNAQTKESN